MDNYIIIKNFHFPDDVKNIIQIYCLTDEEIIKHSDLFHLLDQRKQSDFLIGRLLRKNLFHCINHDFVSFLNVNDFFERTKLKSITDDIFIWLHGSGKIECNINNLYIFPEFFSRSYKFVRRSRCKCMINQGSLINCLLIRLLCKNNYKGFKTICELYDTNHFISHYGTEYIKDIIKMNDLDESFIDYIITKFE
jgi:hypothetical protein